MQSPTLNDLALDIVIVTWNSGDTIGQCLTSLERHRPSSFRVIVIDNASRDSTLEVLHSRASCISILIPNESNHGFAAACNQGAKAGQSSAILFLNPDCEVGAGAIASMISVLQSDSGIAAVGAKLVNRSGVPQRGFAVRSLPRPIDLCFEALLVNRMFPRNSRNRHYRHLDFSYVENTEIEQPAGACLMIRRSVFEGTGGFDERFHPAWFEDVDLCRRLRDQGARIMYCATATTVHEGASSVKSMPPGKASEYFFLNMLRYSRKHCGWGWTAILRCALALGMMMRMVSTLVGPKAWPRADQSGESDHPTRGALERAYWNVMRGVLWQWRP
jgi:N-acetylglucosaminyl-diphospho-decaprenol L-rhamnosyltransferase